MDCTLTQNHLIGYHFAAVSDVEREAVEGHLVECRECLRTYLALKAHMDRAGSEEDGPSEAARLRLRKAVEARFRRTPVRRVRRWLTLPIPLYQGLAVAAAVAAAIVFLPAIARAVHYEPPSHEAERVDSARPAAASLTIY